mmetsp:Transcript_11863/g.21160  ORF Transcript_11863/g.21160 Transcript_11863/m.21160 type:complete len:201 (-) Transcript_11863:1266-1868(-)
MSSLRKFETLPTYGVNPMVNGCVLIIDRCSSMVSTIRSGVAENSKVGSTFCRCTSKRRRSWLFSTVSTRTMFSVTDAKLLFCATSSGSFQVVIDPLRTLASVSSVMRSSPRLQSPANWSSPAPQKLYTAPSATAPNGMDTRSTLLPLVGLSESSNIAIPGFVSRNVMASAVSVVLKASNLTSGRTTWYDSSYVFKMGSMI